MKNKILKNLFSIEVLLIFIGLLWTKVYNFSNYFLESKINDFVDIAVSFGDILVILISLKVYYNLPNKWRVGLLIPILFGLGQLFFNQFFSINSLIVFVLEYFRIFLLIYSLVHIKKVAFSLESKIVFYVSLIIFGFFDHFILSSSIPVLFIYFILLIVSKKTKKNIWWVHILLVVLMLNTVVALYQIITGGYLGLNFFGESFVSTDSTNVAKLKIADQILLRGYGMFEHPNILGFFGVFGFWLIQNIKDYKYSNLAKSLSIVISLLSFSRSTLISLFINFVVNSKRYFKYTYIIIFVFSILIFLYFIMGRGDFYRFSDLYRFGRVYIDSNLVEKLFGIGLGQYPYYLQRIGGLENWQYQPVHNIFLKLIFEIGIIPLVLIDVLFTKLRRL